MRIQQLGHVVIKVRDRDRAEQFYSGVLGLPIVARRDHPPMTFFFSAIIMTSPFLP